jgi:uncharacterized YccA/Bax inhibitor family protein
VESNNPVFRNSGSTRTAKQIGDVEYLYNSPSATSAQTGRLSMDDVVVKTGFLFLLLALSAGFSWAANLGAGAMMIAMLGGMGLGMYNSFARTVHPIAVGIYAVAEGIFLGVISHVYETAYNGIVGQAVLATAATFLGALFAYKSKKIRITPKTYRMAMVAIFAWVGIGLFSMISSFFGVGHGYGFYGVSGLGLLLATGGVLLAAFFIILDFDMVDRAIASNAPREEAWRMGFGLMVTIVWLYLQILQLLGMLRDNN